MRTIFLAAFLSCTATPPCLGGPGTESADACTTDSQCCTGYSCGRALGQESSGNVCTGLVGADCVQNADCQSQVCSNDELCE